MIRLFEGSAHAELYSRFRPKTPALVVDKILAYLSERSPPPHGVAVDVGCGSGQSTPAFAPHFERVYGFDISPAQVALARGEPTGVPANVEYGVAPGERLPLADGSVTLLTGCLSFHWMDFPSFFAEVDRILRPAGVAAAFGQYLRRVGHPTKAAELNALMDAFVRAHLAAEFHPQLSYVFSDYAKLPMPYAGEVRYRDLIVDAELTVADVVGTFSTWSCFQTLYQNDPQAAVASLEGFQRDFMRILGADTTPEKTPITVKREYFLVMCRKPEA